jgi:periplasmic divalent cation tolerance protein
MHDAQIVQVQVAHDDRDALAGLLAEAVERRLAACGQLLGPMTSTFRWEGEVQQAEEWLGLLKTSAVRLDELVAFLAEAPRLRPTRGPRHPGRRRPERLPGLGAHRDVSDLSGLPPRRAAHALPTTPTRVPPESRRASHAPFAPRRARRPRPPRGTHVPAHHAPPLPPPRHVGGRNRVANGRTCRIAAARSVQHALRRSRSSSASCLQTAIYPGCVRVDIRGRSCAGWVALWGIVG